MQGLYWEACFLHKKPEENPFLYWLSTAKGSHFVRWESGGIIFIPVKKEKKKPWKLVKKVLSCLDKFPGKEQVYKNLNQYWSNYVLKNMNFVSS